MSSHAGRFRAARMRLRRGFGNRQCVVRQPDDLLPIAVAVMAKEASSFPLVEETAKADISDAMPMSGSCQQRTFTSRQEQASIACARSTLRTSLVSLP